MLHINHDFKGHLWCGIGSLAAALEVPTSHAKRMIRGASLRKYIKAVTYSEMAHAIARQGIPIRREYHPRDANKCPTLKEWLHSKYRKCGEINVICITGHWIVVRDDEWVCSMNQKARHVDSCPYLQARVRHVVKFHTSSGS